MVIYYEAFIGNHMGNLWGVYGKACVSRYLLTDHQVINKQQNDRRAGQSEDIKAILGIK